MYSVKKLGVRADNSPEGHLDDRKVSFLKIAPEKIGRHFHRQRGALERYRNDGLEPYVELFRIYVLLEDTKTFVPY